MVLNKEYAKRQHSSKKYEDKRSTAKERMPSVYISKEQKQMLTSLKDSTTLTQGKLLITGVNVLSAFHANGINIKDLIEVDNEGGNPDDIEKLVTAKIHLFIDSLIKNQ